MISHTSHRPALAIGVATALMCCSASFAATVTGNPLSDGFAFQGNSLSNGSYVRGSANYGFDMFRAVLTVTEGSNLVTGSGAGAWNVGDTVLAVGGIFQGITAGDAGWSDFSGNGVNSLYDSSTALKLQAKFGTAAGTWSTSTIAPGAGNGAGSLNDGGMGAMQVRTSGSNSFGFWAANADTLNPLASSGHIERSGGSAGMNSSVARLIWNCDDSGRVVSWEVLLNATLLASLTTPGYAGMIPNQDFSAIMTVQNGDGAYTDGLVQGVPSPGALALMGLAGVLGSRRRR